MHFESYHMGKPSPKFQPKTLNTFEHVQADRLDKSRLPKNNRLSKEPSGLSAECPNFKEKHMNTMNTPNLTQPKQTVLWQKTGTPLAKLQFVIPFTF
jgi:hypothetical protein